MAHDDDRPIDETPAFRPFVSRPSATRDGAEPPYDPRRFRLDRDPFAVRPDPSFVYTNLDLRALYASLLDAIRTTPGLVLLTGGPGVGKTAVLDRLVPELRALNFTVITSYRAGLQPEELLATLASELIPPDRQSDDEARPDTISEIIAERSATQAVALVIDDAERLGGEVIRALESLLSSPGDRRRELRLLLAGRPEIHSRLRCPTFTAMADALVLHRELEPLSDEDICCLVWHRLHRAGRSEAHQLFTNSAVAAVACDARGVPGRAVLLCAATLRLASIAGQIIVTDRLVERATSKLDRPSRHFQLETNEPPSVGRASSPSEIIAPPPGKDGRLFPLGRSFTRTFAVAAGGLSAAAIALVVGLSDAGSWASSAAQTLSDSVRPSVLSSHLTNKLAGDRLGELAARQEPLNENAPAEPSQSDIGDDPAARDAPVVLSAIETEADHFSDPPLDAGISGSSDPGDATRHRTITADRDDGPEDARQTADVPPALAPAEGDAPPSAAESIEADAAPPEERAVVADPKPAEATAHDTAPDQDAVSATGGSVAEASPADAGQPGPSDRVATGAGPESPPDAGAGTADAAPQSSGEPSSAPGEAEPVAPEPADQSPAAPAAAEPAVLLPIGPLLVAPMPTAVTSGDARANDSAAAVSSGSSEAPPVPSGSGAPGPSTAGSEPSAAADADPQQPVANETTAPTPAATQPPDVAALPLSNHDTARAATAGSGSVAPAPVAAPAVAPPPPSPRNERASVPPQMIAQLMKRGDEMLAQHDISAARLLYEYAAAAGDARAATAAGKTYDPLFLREITALGMPPQPDRAAAWYRRAAAAGDAEAKARLTRLEDATRR